MKFTIWIIVSIISNDIFDRYSVASYGFILSALIHILLNKSSIQKNISLFSGLVELVFMKQDGFIGREHGMEQKWITRQAT